MDIFLEIVTNPDGFDYTHNTVSLSQIEIFTNWFLESFPATFSLAYLSCSIFEDMNANTCKSYLLLQNYCMQWYFLDINKFMSCVGDARTFQFQM